MEPTKRQRRQMAAAIRKIARAAESRGLILSVRRYNAQSLMHGPLTYITIDLTVRAPRRR